MLLGLSPCFFYIKEKPVCNNGHGCDCEKLHLVNCKNGLTIVAIGWTRGNKKALATILLTEYWEKLRTLPKFDCIDIAEKRANFILNLH
jgi:hypothetical protein